MAYHNTVLSHFLKLIPRLEFEKLANASDAKRRQGALNRWSQFVALTVCQLGARSSLRDIVATIASQPRQRYHLAIQPISRSALSRANERLDFRFYESLFTQLYARCCGHSPKAKFRFKGKLFSIDSSLIELSLKVFAWADFNKMKAAVKLHIGLDHDGLIPAFCVVSTSRVADKSVLRHWRFPKGSVLVFDKGYNDYSLHNSLTEQGLTWVTRLNKNAAFEVVKSYDTSAHAHITDDQLIRYTSKRYRYKCLQPVRRVVYIDPDSDKEYVYITNALNWSAQTIADIYKQRWQVELFFKWIKQNLRIKSFIGNSTNAVMTQVMAAMCVYLMLSFLKFQSKITLSLQQILRLIQTNLFIRRCIVEMLTPATNKPPPCRQITLKLCQN